MRLAIGDGDSIAYDLKPGHGPTVVFLGGYRSDMTGTKASALRQHCERRHQAFLCFDYRGHGASSGDFEALTISDWLDDALAVIDRLVDGPVVLVGSSMGGWVMALVARCRAARVVGMVGIASAPDFCDRVLAPSLSSVEQRQLRKTGVVYRPSAYADEDYPITLRLLEDGREHRVLDKDFTVNGKVRLVHGIDDLDVPWRLSVALAERMTGDNVEVVLVRGGDHRLSSDRDLERLVSLVDEVITAA